MKDYEEYRSLANSISTIEELEEFLAKCDDAISIISKKISSFGIRESGAIDMAKQFVQKYYKDLDFIIPKVNESNTEEDMFSLLRGEKKKVNNEFEGKDISGLSKDYTDWILKIFNLSKAGGEAHSIDDIISLAKTFKSSEQKFEKKIGEFNFYSEASRYLNDNSGVSKKVYTESIRVAAQENDMSRIVFNDDRWTVVLIGSTIGGQWWGRDTDFCISTIEDNLYSSYATEQKIDPYFIIDKLAQSSDPMRKFTIAIQYDRIGKFKISNDSFTMTDARNIGITLDSIYAALGKDYNKVFESINRDAATREENIGTINSNKIAAKVSEKDYEFIRKYEKEIITNNKLTESILKGINNTGDAEKVKNIIKGYADNFSYKFLKNFINEPWTKDYIPRAADRNAEDNPASFLIRFRNEAWAQPYVPRAAENYAKKDPYDFLRDFINEPWAETYFHIAAKILVESNPFNFLTDFRKEPWAKEHITTAAENCAEKYPKYFLHNFTNEPWAKEHIPTAAKSYVNKNSPHDFLRDFSIKPWAHEPREDLDGKSCNQYVIELLRKQEDEIEAGWSGLDREAYYSPRLTKLANVLRSVGLSKEASLVLKIR